MKFLKWLGIILLVLIIFYFSGPQPSTPKLTTDLPVIPAEPPALEQYISNNESNYKLKPDNEARILWFNDSSKQKTEYAIVYLHGFSASQEEGDPVHYEFAQKMGCNLFLARLADHGIDTTEPLLNFTADRLWNSAKQAYAIGKQLGKKVILMSTSTGGTLALKLAAAYPEIAGLILLSPNIAINEPNAWMLNNHWGLQIARVVGGKYFKAKDTTALFAQYWNNTYRMEALVQLEELLETTMKESTFKKVTQPALLLYYYKDEENQDPVVKVSAMKRMFSQLSTPDSLKRQVAIPNAGNHVIGSYVKSKDVQKVGEECEKFAVEVLKMNRE
ncbi:MAG: alpha/beta hydrolase [Chitinophagaceae bacterium]|nr:alpha/beta hydrolase [Chitinophagaceae bacterium]MBK9568658.1 alpha/beta hydrolase [Chitinophagaceae bacterium]MBL0130912.1 alpha/beta hydrolase [Chitinophagaceae bacterium]MBL0272787.1 alpha/beta hydrolase [Chitinophagaceae bacterium]